MLVLRKYLINNIFFYEPPFWNIFFTGKKKIGIVTSLSVGIVARIIIQIKKKIGKCYVGLFVDRDVRG